MGSGVCYKCKKQIHVVMDFPEARRPTSRQVFVMQDKEVDSDTTLITGRILVAGVATKTLLDSGATHSFISEEFVLKWRIQREELIVGFSVTIPSGEDLSTKSIARDLELLLQGQSVKSVLIRPEGVEPFWFEAAKSWRKTQIISLLQERQLISDGCESFLASLSFTELPVKPVLSDVEVVRDFGDVFPDDVAGPPLDREVEFSIDLVLGAVPISKPYLERFVIVFIDDMLIYSKDREEHTQHLRRILEVLRDRRLFAKFDKCEFCLDRIAFLGHVISKSGVEVDPSKFQAVKELAIPSNASEIRSFLGLFGYYRNFMKVFSSIVVPLNALTKKNAKFDWSPECQESFDGLKKTLMTTPVLSIPSGQGDFVVYTDASKLVLGAILMQWDRVISYASR
ncbi:uncharacterized protein [Henckelia pumila]|uniref:uncharacterized protein n=1 Tax=Henckelia pumila TaxID=405737 RepID=UPI003C6E4E2A